MNSARRLDKIIPTPTRILTSVLAGSRLAIGFASALVILGASPATAQTGWNREVSAAAVTPNETAPALWDVNAVIRIDLDDTSTVPLDLSMIVDLRINGTTVASNTHTVGADPGGSSCSDGSSCGGSCGSGSVDGQAMTLLCIADGACNPICDCKCSFPSIASPFTGMTLRPKDEIMVLLRPSPGALPDPDTSDDQRVMTHTGDSIYWDHQIADISAAPSSAGPGLSDITVEGMVLHNGMLNFVDPTTGSVPLSFELDLHVDGILHSTHSIPFDPLPNDYTCGCGEVCGYYEGFPHACLFGNGGGCACGWPWLRLIPAVPVQPGDEIMVLLRPAPGALPELPGFEEDDELRVTPGVTGINATVAIANVGTRLEQNRPNPFEGSTTIAFATEHSAQVRLDVFDVGGRRIRTLVNGSVAGSAAPRNVTWSGRTDTGEAAPVGIYFYRLTLDGKSETRKMTLAR